MFLSKLKPAHRTAVCIALCVAAGLMLRLVLLIEAGWRYDYDEGMVGLQALHILDGARPVFHPGQPYLAALESYMIACVFWVFGATGATLKLVPWLLSGLYIGTTGWLGWRAFDSRTSVLSALLAAGAPAYLLIVGTKAWGATAETLVLGNATLIAASYALDHTLPRTARNRALMVLALFGGVAFWVSWLIAFYGIPILLVIVACDRASLRRNFAGIGLAFLAGSAPVWVYNIQHDWATFHYLFRGQDDTWGNVGAIAEHLNNDLAPRLVSGAPSWHILSWPAIWWLQLVYGAGLVGLLIWAWRSPWNATRRPTRTMLALYAILLPVIYIASGYGNQALNNFGFDATGRYVLMIHSVLPIGAAALATSLTRWRRWLKVPAAAILTSVVALNLLGALRVEPRSAFTSPYYTRQPATLDPLITFLDEHAIWYVWTDVGIAHVLMFETEERILAADWYNIYGAKGIVRFPAVPQRIQQAERVAFVEVVLPEQTDTRFEQAFRRSGVPHSVYRVTPELLVIVPHEPIDPAVLGDGIGYQF